MRKSLALMAFMAAFFVASNSFISAQEPVVEEEAKVEEKKADEGTAAVDAAYTEIDTFLKSRPKSQAEANGRPAEIAKLYEKYKELDFAERGFIVVAMLGLSGKDLEAAKQYEVFSEKYKTVADRAYANYLRGVFPRALGAAIAAEDFDAAKIYFAKNPLASAIQTSLTETEKLSSEAAKKFAEDTRRRLLYSDELTDEQRLQILKNITPKWPKGTTEVPEGSKVVIDGATTLDGEKVSLSDYKGKVLLVDFWATWCGPCIVEMPHVVKTYKKYHDQGFEILAVSFDSAKMDGETDTTIQKVKDAMVKYEMTWKSTYDGKGWKNAEGVTNGIRSIPAAFLIDHTGKLRYQNLRGDALGEKVAELLAEQKAAEEGAEQ